MIGLESEEAISEALEVELRVTESHPHASVEKSGHGSLQVHTDEPPVQPCSLVFKNIALLNINLSLVSLFSPSRFLIMHP